MLARLKRKFLDPKKALMRMLGDVDLPSFPAVVTEALDLLRDEDSSIRAIGDVIADDPGLSVKILKAANSAMYSLRHPARTVQHAVGLLGRGEVESLLLAVAVGSALPRAPGSSFDANRFWEASARRAAVAREIASILHPATRAESFTAALLQDMAVPLLATRRSDDYDPLLARWREDGGDLTVLEQAAFGWDHAEVAVLLCQQWGFPAGLVEAIGSHHDASGAAPPAVRLVSTLGETTAAPDLDRLVERANAEFGLHPEQTRELTTVGFEAASSIAANFA